MPLTLVVKVRSAVIKSGRQNNMSNPTIQDSQQDFLSDLELDECQERQALEEYASQVYEDHEYQDASDDHTSINTINY